jgi:5-methylcytosine-specific restriction endonuclease McrA
MTVATKHGISQYRKGCRCEVCCAAKRAHNQKHRMDPEYWAARRSDNPEYQEQERQRDRRRQQTHERRSAKLTYAQTRRAVMLDAFVETVDSVSVFERCGYICQMCGITCPKDAVWPAKDFPTLDHIIPLAKGGEHSYANTELLCLDCNNHKNDKILERSANG